MNQSWYTDRKQDKEQRKAEVMAYKNAFDDLTEVIKKNYVKKAAVRKYDTDNWHIQQIAVNEYNAVIDDILNLIDLTKD